MNSTTLRNRIVAHHRVRARELKAHPLNPRLHGDAQRSALRGLLEEIGLARSVLAYVADADRPLGAEAPLTLIDGHLRRDELGDAEVDVEVLDVNDAEARALLLSLDPLAQLADYDAALLAELRGAVEPESAAVAALWATLDANDAAVRRHLEEAELAAEPSPPPLEEAFYVLVECHDEEEQRALLARLQAEGWKCQAKIM